MKKGFTLAEVLITLGIIGVVAAMTIPTLIQNYNTRVWNTAATVFDRKLEDALKTMNTQQTLAGHSSTESFVEELSKHFKANKICQNDELLDCFSETVYWGGGTATPEEVDMSVIRSARSFGQDDWNTNVVGVQFANGVNAMIAYNPTNTCTQDPYSNRVTGGDCLAILYDTSGEKNPNFSGKDLRANSNVIKLGKGCYKEINGVCFTSQPFIPVAHNWNACQSNGTSTDAQDQEIMKKYGIQSCRNGDDYWAGAVKACGGINYMPSMADLRKLSSYLYDGFTRYSVNTTKLNEIGLEFTYTDSYGVQYTYIWSSEIVYETQVSADKVAASSASYTTNHERTNPLFHAMCKF